MLEGYSTLPSRQMLRVRLPGELFLRPSRPGELEKGVCYSQLKAAGEASCGVRGCQPVGGAEEAAKSPLHPTGLRERGGRGWDEGWGTASSKENPS